jgi:hypothetical protein
LAISRAALNYVIDDQDRLVKVDQGFYAFAAENGWDGAGSSLGRSLWDFVAGAELRKLQRMLLRRVRDDLGSVDLPFRCDGPTVRREMDIHIASQAPGRFVAFSARLRAEERRDEFQPLLASETPRGEETLTMCGWCDRFLVDGDWVEVEEAAARLRLFRASKLPAISHGVCPDCTEMLLAA